MGTAIGQQLDNLTQALKDPGQAADLLAKTTAKLNAEQIQRIDQLVEEGRAVEAQAIVYKQLVDTLGQETVDSRSASR